MLDLDLFLPQLSNTCKGFRNELTKCESSTRRLELCDEPDSTVQLLLRMETFEMIPKHHIQSAEAFFLLFKYYQLSHNSARMLLYVKLYLGLFEELMGGVASRTLLEALYSFLREIKRMPCGAESLWTRDLKEVSVAFHRKFLRVYFLVEGGRFENSRIEHENWVTGDTRNSLVRFLAELPPEPNTITECMLCGETPERVAITLSRCS
eukprot:gene41257-51076_t